MSTADSIDFDALWDYDHPAQTEQRFRELLPDLEKNPDLYWQLVTQVARSQGLQRDFAAAHQTLDAMMPALAEQSPRTRIRYLLERGRVFNSQGQQETARPLFEQAYRLASDDPAEQFYAVDAAHMLAIAADPEEALAWNITALELAENSADERTRKWQGSLLNNIGWTYFDRGDPAPALAYFQQALAFRREQGADEETRIARWCVARAQRALGQVAEALAEQRSLRVEYKSLGRDSGYVDEEIGECYLSLGDQATARPFFARAFQKLSQDPWLAANEPNRLARLQTLGEVGGSPDIRT